jgi:hypothetical protein
MLVSATKAILQIVAYAMLRRKQPAVYPKTQTPSRLCLRRGSAHLTDPDSDKSTAGSIRGCYSITTASATDGVCRRAAIDGARRAAPAPCPPTLAAWAPHVVARDRFASKRLGASIAIALAIVIAVVMCYCQRDDMAACARVDRRGKVYVLVCMCSWLRVTRLVWPPVHTAHVTVLC